MIGRYACRYLDTAHFRWQCDGVILWGKIILMWRNARDFVTDLLKKLIVSILSGALVVAASIVYGKSIYVALSTFDADWYTTYWYIVFIAFWLGVLQFWALLAHRLRFHWLLIMQIGLWIIYAAYRLRLVIWIGEVPLILYFFAILCSILASGHFVRLRHM